MSRRNSHKWFKEQKFIGAAKSADILHVSRRNLCRMADEGKVPAFKIGDKWHFRECDLKAYLQTVMRRARRVAKMQNFS